MAGSEFIENGGRAVILDFGLDHDAHEITTRTLEDVETGRIIATEVRAAVPADVLRLEQAWKFDSRATIESDEVFKLIDPADPNAILGLLALRRHDSFIEVTLLESHPRHVGRTKEFRGIAGSLFAFADQVSFKIGAKGFIAIDAKNELIEHYRDL